MALTFPRWLSVFLIGALLTVPLAFRQTEDRFVSPPIPREVEVSRQLARATGVAASMAERVRLAQLRDSITKGPLATHPVAPGVSVAMDRALDAHVLPDLEALVIHSRALAVPREIRTPVVVAFVLDTLTMVRGAQRDSYHADVAPDYILPAAPGAACTVLARVGSRALPSFRGAESFGDRVGSDDTYERLLGPCALYAAFGTPGRYITQWLKGGGWAFAAVNNWEVQSAPSFRPPTDRTGPPGVVQYSAYDLSRENGFFGFEGNVTRARLNVTGLGCLASKSNACIEGLMHADPAAFALQMHGPGFFAFGATYVRYRGPVLPFGNYGEDLLSDFIYRNGQERFGRMWRSDLPVIDAFRVGAGVDIEQATREWAQHSYGVQQLGPVMHTAGVVSGGMGILLGLLITFRAARRREVT